VFARTGIRRFRSRRIPDTIVLLNDDAVNAALTEFDREGESDRPGADD
jgi:hypothetical protein